MIFVMGISMLKLDRAKAKWRVKLQHAFHRGDRNSRFISPFRFYVDAFHAVDVDKRTKSGKWILFVLPFITVLREGMFPSQFSSRTTQKSLPT
jgi:high-affinity iron transporter